MSNESLLPIGTRIKFVKRLSCGPTGDHPAFLFAPQGGLGTITGHGCKEGYWAKWDGNVNSFVVWRDEFTTVEASE